MADGEVKIHVSADADLKGIDEAQRKVDQVNRGQSQTASEANRRPSTPQATPAGGDPLDRQLEKLKKLRAEQRNLETLGDKQGATSVRRQADKMEKDIDREGNRRLRVEDAEAKRVAAETTRDAKIRAAEERHVTREVREQNAMRKAGVGRVGRGAAHVADAAAAASPGGGGFGGGLIRAAAATGNPVAITAAVAAAVGVGIATVLAKEADKDDLQQMSYDQNRKAAQRAQARMAGVHGSSGSLMSASLDAKEDSAAREAARPALEKKAALKWYDPASWLNAMGLRKSDAQRDLEDSEQARIQSGIMAESNKRQAQGKYLKEEGEIELSFLRNRSKRTAEGQQGAMADEMRGKWLSKYKEAARAGGSDSTAKEMADLTVQNELRDRQAQAGAGLVDARSGGAGIAAAARWSQGAVPGQDQVAAAIASLHQTVSQGNDSSQIKDHSKQTIK